MANTSRYDKILEGAALWGAYYRKRPEEFTEDYLHIKLRLFQKILLVMMFWSTTFVFIAARGLGKTYLSAVYCVIRCVLYPGTKVCIASGTRGQAINVLEKIMLDLKPNSPELRAEINEKDTHTNGTDAKVVFFNTSVIKVVTAGDSARGNRCNVLLLDEYRLISKYAIDQILKKFLTQRRMPKYNQLTEAERNIEYDKEKNLTLYLSSAYWKDHWCYTKCVDTLKAMVNPNLHYFVCGFPYQLSISEGLLDADIVADDMMSSDFSDIRFSMEMCAEFYGSEEGAFFDFDTISKTRKIKYPMLPDRISSKVSSGHDFRITPKINGEVRILSVDVALMSSRKHNNDATAIFLNQMLMTRAGRYISNFVYTETYEGLRTDDLALIIRRLFDEFLCDYLVLDTSGIGLGVYDCLARDIVDADSGDIYPALSCCNNDEMAARCTVPGAKKVIWAIKASAAFNSDCAFALREGFRSNRIRLLQTEYDSEKTLSGVKGYDNLNPQERVRFQLPYINTTLLIDELTKLQHEESGGKVRIFERSGMRKDRYSSISYNYYVAIQVENKELKKHNYFSQSTEEFIIRPPSYKRGSNITGRRYGGRRYGW